MVLDPIDRIASCYLDHCEHALHVYAEIDFIFRTSDTETQALKMLERMHYVEYLDPARPAHVCPFLERYSIALESINDIVRMAKKVFIFNFYESDADVVFRKEVCFSFACKQLSHCGPLLCHFASNPTQQQVVHAELDLACRTPFLRFNAETDLYCLETMTSERESSSFLQFIPSPQSACL